MKLPELQEFSKPGSMDGISRFELAQLYCLRSIAVSLEQLTQIIGLASKSISPSVYATLTNMLAHNSVAEIPEEDKEEKHDRS